jgi:hypothetical protein
MATDDRGRRCNRASLAGIVIIALLPSFLTNVDVAVVGVIVAIVVAVCAAGNTIAAVTAAIMPLIYYVSVLSAI